MKLAMAQMQMTSNIEENLQTAIHKMEAAKKNGADFIFFPEVQLPPFLHRKKSKMPPFGWYARTDRKSLCSAKPAEDSDCGQVPMSILNWMGRIMTPL